MYKVNKLLIVAGIIFSALLASAGTPRVLPTKSFDKGKIFVKGPLPNEIDEGEAKELADEKSIVWKCDEQYEDAGKLKNAPGTKTYVSGKLSGTRNKYKTRKAVRAGEQFYSCQDQRIDENTDRLTKK